MDILAGEHKKYKMEFSAEGKVAVVTGSSRGLGYTFAEALIIGKAKRVYINSRKGKAVEDAAKLLREFAKNQKLNTEIVPIATNVNNTEGVEKLIQGVVGNGDQKIDILIANAGASWGQLLESHPEEAITKVLDLNLKGVFLTIQKFLLLLKKPHGQSVDPSRVLVVSSIAGMSHSRSTNAYGYLASKAGVTHLGKLLSLQLPPEYNVNVNVLAPGFFPSKMSNGLLSKFGKEYVQDNPRQRLGEDSDLRPVILFLVDKRTNYINGTVIPIDGGHHNLGAKL